MLVSVDIAKGIVTVFGTTVFTIPLAQFDKLRHILRDKTVHYVTEVVETTGEEVLEMLADLSADLNVGQSSPTLTQGDGRMWLYATGSGYLNIPNPELIFKGKMDFKSLDELGYDLTERFPVIQSLVDQGKLAIVNTADKIRLTQFAQQQQMQFEERKLLNADGTDIVVDTSGGKIVNGTYTMPKDFIDVDTSQDESEFVSDAAKIALIEGWGKSEAQAAEAEVE